jgi:hypothetical protein
VTEVSSERAQAAARQIGQQTPGNIPRADHVEWKDAGGQRAKERLLESSEVDDRRRGLLRETRGLIGQRAPGELPVDCSPHHVLGDASNPRNGWRNLLAIWKRDQARMRVRNRVADVGPADFKEMSSRCRGRGLAVDDQHLELRERFETNAWHHCHTLIARAPLRSRVRADCDAIAPATNLLHREPMTGGRLAHLDLELRSWRDRVGPTTAFQRCDAESCGVVDPRSPAPNAEHRTDR